MIGYNTDKMASVTRRLFTVDEFEQMESAGIFHPEERLELIEGEFFEMSPTGDRHDYFVDRLNYLLTGEELRNKAIVRVQSPVKISFFSAPQPDLTLFKYREDFYRHGRPTPADVLLVIEVSDTTQRHDRGKKALLYARHGIPEYWLFDLRENRVEVYRKPSPEGYKQVFHVERDETLFPEAFPDFSLPLNELFG